MNCVVCDDKSCRKKLKACGNEAIDCHGAIDLYKEENNKKIVEVAALLVDKGRAGSLSRLAEIIEFIQLMEYKNVGLAYCYGMEKYAVAVKQIFNDNNLSLSTVSCSVGALAQDEVNTSSCIHKVSCNPIGQALQLSSENVDFVVIMGICLGHDILLQRSLKCDFTNYVVKDRINNHQPLLGLIMENFSKENGKTKL